MKLVVRFFLPSFITKHESSFVSILIGALHAAPWKCLRILPLVRFLYRYLLSQFAAGIPSRSPTRFRFCTYELNSGGPIKRKAREGNRLKKRGMEDEEGAGRCGVRLACAHVCISIHTSICMYRDDTIVHVALIPQLHWIQLLTLLYVCLCVTDQTREAVLHCGSGGGLAGEYFLIYSLVGVMERGIRDVFLDIAYLWHITSSDSRCVKYF